MDFEATVEIILKIPNIGSEQTLQRPTKCPRCNNGIGAEVINVYRYKASDGLTMVSVVFQCNHCFKPFICIYQEEKVKRTIDGGMMIIDEYSYELIDIGPVGIQKHPFSKEISELSQKFIDIYNQAYAAEQYQLTDVCGMAYRKALEFLLKTFLIKRNPDKNSEIAEMALSKCINQYVDNARIKTTAEKCVWLANDHAHYLNHHADNDLEDLKKLLRIVINYVESELIMDAAEAIPRKDPK